jgi:hypothetical protein
LPAGDDELDGVLRAKMGVEAKTWRNPEAVAEILTGESSDVWHIHGYWDDPESVVFSNADYGRVRLSDRAQFLQRHAAFADTLIFIGCSADGLADKNIGKLSKWFGDFGVGWQRAFCRGARKRHERVRLATGRHPCAVRDKAR